MSRFLDCAGVCPGPGAVGDELGGISGRFSGGSANPRGRECLNNGAGVANTRVGATGEDAGVEVVALAIACGHRTPAAAGWRGFRRRGAAAGASAAALGGRSGPARWRPLPGGTSMATVFVERWSRKAARGGGRWGRGVTVGQLVVFAAATAAGVAYLCGECCGKAAKGPGSAPGR